MKNIKEFINESLIIEGQKSFFMYLFGDLYGEDEDLTDAADGKKEVDYQKLVDVMKDHLNEMDSEEIRYRNLGKFRKLLKEYPAQNKEKVEKMLKNYVKHLADEDPGEFFGWD